METSNPYPGIKEAISEVRQELKAETPAFTTIGVYLSRDAKRKYTYKCALPVEAGDRVNVKLPSGQIFTAEVIDVHPSPQLSDKWETKWSVVVQTRAEWQAAQSQGSELGKELGL